MEETKYFDVEATLISADYIPSSYSSSYVSLGKESGWVSTGKEEVYVTVWDCGKYGKLISHKKKVFRYSKPKAILVLRKDYFQGIVIDGIKREEE